MLERKDVGINTARWSARRRYRIWHSLGLAVERQLAHAAARPVASSSIPLRRGDGDGDAIALTCTRKGMGRAQKGIEGGDLLVYSEHSRLPARRVQYVVLGGIGG
jgi:hypothetical protein